MAELATCENPDELGFLRVTMHSTRLTELYKTLSIANLIRPQLTELEPNNHYSKRKFEILRVKAMLEKIIMVTGVCIAI